MYADLHSFGGFTNKDAARILLSSRISAGGKSPRDRIEENRTFLSREVVHVDPKKVNPAIYADFFSSVQTLRSRMATHLGKRDSSARIVEHYRGEAAESMCEALAAHGLDEQVYRNECARLVRVRLMSERDRDLLLLMLFCITGCLADSRQATNLVEEFARHRLAMDLTTMSVDADAESAECQGELRRSLGLLRLMNGVARPPIHILSPSGTVVGSLAMGRSVVTAVEPDVSRQHARVWFEDGRWLCEGLGSTNGTTVIQGKNKQVLSIEPPRKARAPKTTYPPQEIHEGDILCFGKNTQYLVMRVTPRS
jgi:hypothetical protein